MTVRVGFLEYAFSVIPEPPFRLRQLELVIHGKARVIKNRKYLHPHPTLRGLTTLNMGHSASPHNEYPHIRKPHVTLGD